MTFRGLAWTAKALVLAVSLGSAVARAENLPEGQSPASRRRIVYDCARYLSAAVVRNFSIRNVIEPNRVPVVDIDPATVRSVDQAIDAAIDRVLQVAIDRVLVALRSEKVLSGVEMPDVEVLASFAKTKQQRELVRKGVRQIELETWAEMRKYKPGGELAGSAGSGLRMHKFQSLLDYVKKVREQLKQSPGRIVPQVEETAMAGAPENSDQHAIYAGVEKWVGWLFGKSSKPARLLGDVKRIVLADGAEISHGNDQIIQYWGRALLEDRVLYGDALDFYSRLNRLDLSFPADGIREPKVDSSASSVNVWVLALETTGGDVSRAIRVISVFGHDDVLQRFTSENFYLRLLDTVVPATRNSLLYRNGAIDGLRISDGLVARFRAIEKELAALVARFPESPLGDWTGAFRAGNYHFIGGAMMVHELYRMGNESFLGVNLPLVVAEAAGKAYKRITMERSYLGMNESYLFQRGYPKKAVVRPADWSEDEYEFAKLKVRLHLLHLDLTHEQHLAGARWAYGLLKKHGVTKYPPKAVAAE